MSKMSSDKNFKYFLILLLALLPIHYIGAMKPMVSYPLFEKEPKINPRDLQEELRAEIYELWPQFFDAKEKADKIGKTELARTAWKSLKDAIILQNGKGTAVWNLINQLIKKTLWQYTPESVDSKKPLESAKISIYDKSELIKSTWEIDGEIYESFVNIERHSFLKENIVEDLQNIRNILEKETSILNK